MLNLNPLNLMQKIAVTTTSKKVFVVAGAGCGKTRVLTYRIAYLLESGLDEKNIYAFTFTNRAASEMKYRLYDLLGYTPEVHLSTFHSFAYYVVDLFSNHLNFKRHIKIIDEDEKGKIISSIMREKQIPLSSQIVAKEISNLKSLTGFKITQASLIMIVLKVALIYQETLQKSNLMDFDDLLYYFYHLLKTNEDLQNWFKESTHILVDECQDINIIQYEIIKLLGKKSHNIFMVGDEDQCIYSFRGSDIRCIRDYIDNEKADVIKLEQNYRSCKNILMAANSVIKHNEARVDKRLYTTYNEKNYKLIIADFNRDAEEAIYIADLIEALNTKGYNYHDFTILYRNNYISVPVEKELLKRKIPFHIFGKVPFFKKKEVKLLIYYLRLILNHHDDLAFLEIINSPRRGIGSYTLDRIKEYAEKESLSYYEAICKKEDLYKIESISNFIKMINKFTTIINGCDLLVYIKELIKDLDYYKILRSEKNPKEKIGNVDTFLEMIDEIEIKGNQVDTLNSFLSDIYLDATKPPQDKNYVKLMTIHQAKGLEYKIVILSGCNDGIIPASHNKDTMQEERRLFYVAITRAKERLFLLSSNKRLVNGQYKTYPICPFVLEINKTTVNFN